MKVTSRSRRLPFKVFPDFLDLLFGSFQHDRLPRWARRTTLQRVCESLNNKLWSGRMRDKRCLLGVVEGKQRANGLCGYPVIA